MPSAAEEFVGHLLQQAIIANASDIHLEPFADHFQIRLRTPLGLTTLPAPATSLFPAIARHLQLLAALDIAQEQLPQDGKFSYSIGGGAIEFRLSCLPTLYGPSIVLRVLDPHRIPLQLDQLGFTAEILADLKRALALPFGLITVVGATGSGKTTTLYAALRHLADRQTLKILSAEDPIEFPLVGVQQVAVSTKISFPLALRAFLRHDPDVIFIGEIRDRISAQLAIQSALTGHLVLASLHTASPEQAVRRLTDLGVAPYLIHSALKFTLAQQLTSTPLGTRTPVGQSLWHTPSHA